jgi:hypothetical protein
MFTNRNALSKTLLLNKKKYGNYTKIKRNN